MAARLVLDRRTLITIAIVFVLLVVLTVHRLFLAVPPRPENPVIVIAGETMGSTYEVRIAGAGLDDALRERAETMIARRLAEIDLWFSTWRPDSEVARFNAQRDTDPFAVSVETADLIARSIELCRRSGGAFDITVGPLVGRWGFGHAAQYAKPPTESELGEYRSRMGAEMVSVGGSSSASGGLLQKHDPRVEVDLSAIAPGHAADYLAAGLRQLDRRDFLVDIGGEIYAGGERPGGGSWRVAIEEPLEDVRSIHSVVELSNQGLATSGDYRAFYVEDGRRVSHTIDPRTGRPIENGMASATVIAPDAATADGWATALMVLGPEAGLALTEQWSLAAMTISRAEDGGLRERRNALFPEPVALDRQPALDAGPSDPMP